MNSIKPWREKLKSYMQLAVDIMGPRFISPQMISRAFGIKWTTKQLAALQFFLVPPDLVEPVRDTHVLVPLPSRNLAWFVRKYPHLFYGWSGYHERELFFRTPMNLGWAFLRTTPYPDSNNLSYHEQCCLLSKGSFDYVPNVCEVVYLALISLKISSFLHIEEVRCADRTSLGKRVQVSGPLPFLMRQIFVTTRSDFEKAPRLGLASGYYPPR
jgi:hypothetical protein